jgi:DnaJ-related protein SCJ1
MIFSIPLLLVIIWVVHARDFYEILGLPRETSDRAIKKAYRKLSMKYHPDKNADNTEAHDKFVEITQAYEVLGDKEKRRRYDLYGEEGVKEQAGGSNPFDMFNNFFGFGDGGFFGNQQQHQERRGPSTTVILPVTLDDLYNGAEIDVDVSRWHICPKCRGLGAKDASDVETCSVCGGQGVRIMRQMLAPGMYQQIQTPCDACGGQGKTIKTKCPHCDGHKVVRDNVQITVTVEKGMTMDEIITFERFGDESPDYAAGDLKFVVKVIDHAVFTRQGNDLFMKMNITLVEALVGFDKEIEHMDKRKVSVTRSEVTPSGYRHKVEHEGMPQHQYPSERGDLYVDMYVEFPATLTEEQKSKLKQVLQDKPMEGHDEL